jgi:hypothetical protein
METITGSCTKLKIPPGRSFRGSDINKVSPIPEVIRDLFESAVFGVPLRKPDEDEKKFQLPADVSEEVLEKIFINGEEVDPPVVENNNFGMDLEALEAFINKRLWNMKEFFKKYENNAIPRRKIVVIGAGPVGLTAAIILALRGHSVVLVEKRELNVRGRMIGLYPETSAIMDALGAPGCLFYNCVHYRGKYGVWVSDLQTFLHAAAAKCGVNLILGGEIDLDSLKALNSGESKEKQIQVTMAKKSKRFLMFKQDEAFEIGSESIVELNMDTIVDASGGGFGLVKVMVPERAEIVSLKKTVASAILRDPSLKNNLGKSNRLMNDAGDLKKLLKLAQSEPDKFQEEIESFSKSLSANLVPDEIPCFVCNIDSQILTDDVSPLAPTADGYAYTTQVGDTKLQLLPNWVMVQMQASGDLDKKARVQIEGPLPWSHKGVDISREIDEGKVDPFEVMVRTMFCFGIKKELINKLELDMVAYVENIRGGVSDRACVWTSKYRSLQLDPENPIWTGETGSHSGTLYALIGDCLVSPWFRFGTGLWDGVYGAAVFSSTLEVEEQGRLKQMRGELEDRLISRAVQIMYTFYKLTDIEVQRRFEEGLGSVCVKEEDASKPRALDRMNSMPSPGQILELSRGFTAQLESDGLAPETTHLYRQLSFH